MDGWIAAKIVKFNHAIACYYAFKGKEHGCTDFEILIHKQGYAPLEWIAASNGYMPPYLAITTKDENFGKIRNGIGRVYVNGRITVGKIMHGYTVLSAPYGGAELEFKDYEVLCEEDGEIIPGGR